MSGLNWIGKKYYLTVNLFGAAAATTRNTPLTFRSDKVRALFAYLVMHPNTSISRNELTYKLFGDFTEQGGRKNLNLTLTRLRESLAPVQANLGNMQILESDREQIIFHWQPDYFWADALEFLALQETNRLHPHEALTRCTQCQQRLKTMADLYRGPFLANLQLKENPEFNEWRLWQQESFQQQALEILYGLTESALAAANYPDALTYAQNQLSLAPWQERTHRQLIQSFVALGQYAAAHAQFNTLKQMLAEKFGVAPGTETLALMQTIPAQMEAPSLPDTLPPHDASLIYDLNRLLLDPVNRLITLLGQDEAKMTELALAAAQRLVSQFPDGICSIPLTDADPEQPETLAAALSLQLATDPPSLLSFLKPLRLLLILHPFTPFVRPTTLADGVSLVIDILREAPQVTMLVVSARPLRLQQEIVYRP